MPLFQLIDKSFGFDITVVEAQRENGIGLVKLIGRYSGKFLVCPLYTLARYDMPLANCVL